MLKLQNQDKATRWLMVSELDSDDRAGRLYDSPVLTEEGREFYPSLLRDAVLNFDEEQLADELIKQDLVAKSEPVGQNGREVVITPEMVRNLVAQEFNRLYCRAICRRAIEGGIPYVEVYRAEDVPGASPESEQHVGESIHPEDLLAALRKCDSLEGALGMPSRPRSGLSLRLPR